MSDFTTLCFVYKGTANEFRELAVKLHDGRKRGSIETEFMRMINSHIVKMKNEISKKITEEPLKNVLDS